MSSKNTISEKFSIRKSNKPTLRHHIFDLMEIPLSWDSHYLQKRILPGSSYRGQTGAGEANAWDGESLLWLMGDSEYTYTVPSSLRPWQKGRKPEFTGH